MLTKHNGLISDAKRYSVLLLLLLQKRRITPVWLRRTCNNEVITYDYRVSYVVMSLLQWITAKDDATGGHWVCKMEIPNQLQLLPHIPVPMLVCCMEITCEHVNNIN